MLKRGRGTMLWRQIRDTLAQEIENAVLAAGDRLPSEKKLADRFEVNRHTVRRALEDLARSGLIRIEHGRGSFVQEPVIHYSVQRRTRFSENIYQQQRAPRNVLLQAVEAPADANVAQALGIHPGDMVIRIAAAGEADGRRISYSNSFFSKKRFPTMKIAFRDTGSITQALAMFGVHDYTRKSTKVIARMPTTAEAHILAQPKTRPVLCTESVNVDQKGAPVEFGVCLFASDWVQLHVELPGAPGDDSSQ